MQFNKIVKGLIIALPVVTMMACSSNSGPSEAELEAQNRAAQEQAEAEAARLAREAEDAKVKAGAMDRMMSPEEEKMQQLEALQNEQVVYFDFDRSSVSSDFYSVLDKHAAFLLKNSDQSIVIEGHCDSRGTPEYNIALGERRAKSIETYLQNAGVSASQISVVSYGEEKPAVEGGTEAAFAKNRRGVLVYQ